MVRNRALHMVIVGLVLDLSLTIPCVAFESFVGLNVMPRIGCKILRDGKSLEVEAIPLPLRVVAQNGTTLTTKSGKVQVDDIVTLTDAIPYYTDVLAQSGRNASAFRYRALTHALNQDFESALADIKTAIDIKPDSPQFIKNHADILYLKGNHAEAARQFKKAVELDPTFVGAYMNHAVMLAKAQNCLPAILLLRKVLRLDPSRDEAWALIGDCFRSEGRWDRGIECLNIAIRLSDRDDYRYLRASLFLKVDMYQEMLDDAKVAIDLQADFPLAHAARAYALLKLSNTGDALDVLEETIQRKLAGAGALRVRCLVWSTLGEHGKQLADLDAWVNENPDDSAAHVELGLFLATQSDSALRDGRLAVRHAVKGCTMTGWNHFGPLSTLAAAKAEVGDFVEAEKMETRAINAAEKHISKFLEQRLALIRRIASEDASDREVKAGWDEAVISAKTACEASQWLKANQIDRLSILSAEKGDLEGAIELHHKLQLALNAALLTTMKDHLASYRERRPLRCKSGNYIEDIVGVIGGIP